MENAKRSAAQQQKNGKALFEATFFFSDYLGIRLSENAAGKFCEATELAAGKVVHKESFEQRSCTDKDSTGGFFTIIFFL